MIIQGNRVDKSDEVRNRFTGQFIEDWLDGNLVGIKKIPAEKIGKPVQATMKASEQGDTANTKANGGKK